MIFSKNGEILHCYSKITIFPAKDCSNVSQTEFVLQSFFSFFVGTSCNLTQTQTQTEKQKDVFNL